MTKIPVEEQFTREQLQKKVHRFRRLIKLFGGRRMNPKHPAGAERFLETEAGRVRVLAYNLDATGTLPLFVDIHGGGFVMGSPEMDDRFMPGIVAGAGVKILSIDYSLAPEAMFPVALNECYAVVKYAKEHAAELGIDPERIAVGGHSAGGTLSAGICLLDGERRELGPKCLILDYPPLDMHTDPYLKPYPRGALRRSMCRMFDQAYAGTREAAKDPLLSPYYATVDQVRSFPPTLVITASQDSLAPEAEAFAQKLRDAGVAVTAKRFEKARHGFTLRKGRAADEAWQMMIDHLRRHLGSE
jgi:acetyl esterase